MQRKLLAVLLAFIMVASALTAAVVIMTPSTPSTVNIRVGYITGDIHHLPFAVADNVNVSADTTVFDKWGLNVTAKGYANGGAIMTVGFKQDEVDIAYMGAAPAISQHLNLGRDAVNTTIISQVNEEGSLIVADSTITNASNLVGKKVATPGAASIQYLLLLMYLEQNGVNKSAVNITTLGAGLMQTYLEKPLADPDHISAFIAWEPYGSSAVSAGSGHVLATSHEIWADHPCCVVVANKKFAADHPDIIDKFLSAHKEAIDWINGAKASTSSADYDELVALSKSWTAKNESVAVSALGKVHYSYSLSTDFTDKIETFTENLIEFGVVAPSALTSNGNDYASVQDFATRYVDESYLA